MADDIDELLDEVQSKFINSDSLTSDVQASAQQSSRKSERGAEELDAAIHSICSIPEPVEASAVPTSAIQLAKGNKRKCTVLYVGGSAVSSGVSSNVSQRRTPQRKSKSILSSKMKKYFTKPVFELSVKDLEAESARRKQKEIIETLFEQKKAEVTDKMILDVRKFKRIKSDVWSNFGDVRLLISEAEVKKLNIDYHVIHIEDEEHLLCKCFVACVKCCAVFSYESHSYGTSTLRSHLKSCGKPRYNMKEKKSQMLRLKRQRAEIFPKENTENDTRELNASKPVFQEHVLKFRDGASKLQEQILVFFLSKLKSFDVLENQEFKSLLQTFIQVGANMGDLDVMNFLCTPNELSDVLLNKMYIKSEQAFQSEVLAQYGLSFSIELWVDNVEKLSYITIYCHYANNEGVLRSVALLTTEFPYDTKTSGDIVKLFNDCLTFMHLSLYKRLIVTDYSENMINAFESEQFMLCICYSLNCAVQSVINTLSMQENEDDPFALPGFATLISQCRSLVLHFKENKLQTNLPKYLHLCTSTCWKSILEMLESINNQWDHISDILNERSELHLFDFDLELLGLVVDFLEIFRDGWKELSSVSAPTINVVIPWFQKWKSHCVQNTDESPFLATLKSYMSTYIEDEVGGRITPIHKVATMLDPRYKGLETLSLEDQNEARLQADMLVSQCKETLQYTTVTDSSDTTATQASEGMSQNFHSVDDNESDNTISLKEVDDYLSENFIMGQHDVDSEKRFNPLKYWARNKVRFPNLSRVALWILSCPASSVRSDNNMLASDWIVTVKETDLMPKYLHMGMFIKSFNRL